MHSLSQRIDQRLTALENLAGRVIGRDYQNIGDFDQVNATLYSELRVSTVSFLAAVLGEGNSYYIELAGKYERADAHGMRRLLGVLRGVRAEFNTGWLDSVRGIVSAEIFTDFMEMAEHLLVEGYKDAAAVIIGSTLEGQLRTLSTKRGLPTAQLKEGKDVPLKAEALNIELAKAGVYHVTQQKLVTAWLGLRNDAAHGHHEKYEVANVRLMHDGVLLFLTQTYISAWRPCELVLHLVASVPNASGAAAGPLVTFRCIRHFTMKPK